MSDTRRVRKGRDPNFARRAIVILLATFVALGAAAWWVIVDERARTECGFTPPDLPERLRLASSHADWAWWPPGHVCIYTNDEGRVIGRRRI